MDLENIEIPKKVEVTLYTYLCVQSKYSHQIGQINTNVCDMESIYKDDPTESYVTIHAAPVSYKIPPKKLDPRAALIENLETALQATLARHYKEIEEINNKLDKLKAIEYKLDAT